MPSSAGRTLTTHTCVHSSMDLSKWCDLVSAPSLKNLTETNFGVPKKKQHVPVQELVKAHIESFDQAVTDGLCRVVGVSTTYFVFCILY